MLLMDIGKLIVTGVVAYYVGKGCLLYTSDAADEL
mgnify:CR=1 FL=1